MSTTPELRQLLKEDKNGQNLYDHLVQVLMKVALERPGNAYEAFELISADVKANPLTPAPDLGRQLPDSAEQLEKQLLFASRNAALLKVPDEAPEDNGVKLPELLDDANLLEWASVSFGRAEIYRLFLAIKKLAESLSGDVERIRFVGRINTRTLPYFIVEGVNPEEIDGLDESKQEGKNGANKYAYWVIQVPESGQWTKLPNITADQVVKARLVRRLMNGNLESEVCAYPPFPGQEKHYLRAILACIVGETSVSPDGFFDLDSDSDPPVIKAAEAEAFNERFPKAASELKELDAWKHHEVELNKIGRMTALPEQLDDNGEPIPVEDPVEVNPPLDALKPELWTARACPGGAGFTNNSSVVVLRSLKWPGAVAVAAGRKYVNVYVGNGLPYAQGTTYSPPLPAAIQVEWANTPSAADANIMNALNEQPDVKIDPTPPAPEGENAEE